jgi:eukaryotic-like serine/threonine-protein kinase
VNGYQEDKMNNETEKWRLVEDVYHAALETAAGQRAAFLDQACAGDETLRHEVESLLAAHDQAEHFLSQPAGEVATRLFTTERESAAITATLPKSIAIATADPGQRIGHYKLIRELGRGGMGVVYLAERADEQYHKQVAIKLLRRGSYDESLLRRFRAERQILAQLDHPHIARFLEGGVTDSGDPYLVMEYIEGSPLDDYCDERKLSITERLKLFRDACSAAQYAHQNLIVHRDLKPSNILVTKEGVVKLLDFGIAKLLEIESFALTVEETATGMRLMTPQYASPEQARGEALSTVSDVYSLGVILYELLTGQPYRFDSRAPDDVVRIICESEPIKPSSAVTREGEIQTGGVMKKITPESVSAARGEQPEKLRRRLADELDNIVLTALRKEPARRYASVEQFSEDIRLYLEGRPVRARKDTLGYRALKFVKRNRAGVITAVMVGLALLAGIVGTSWQARVAQRERDLAKRRFDEVRKLANAVLFDYHDGVERLAGSTAVRERMVKDALEYLDKLSREAGNDPSLQSELATAYEKIGQIQSSPNLANLGDFDRALNSQRKALAMRESLLLAALHDTGIRNALAKSHQHVGDLLSRMGETDEALRHYQESQRLLEALVAADPANEKFKGNLTRAYNAIGVIHSSRGNKTAALENHRKSLTVCQEMAKNAPTNENRRDLVVAYVNVGDDLYASGRISEGLASYRQALPIVTELARANPANAQLQRDLGLVYHRIGDAQFELGDLPTALESFREDMKIGVALAQADPQNALARRDLVVGHHKLGKILTAMRDWAGALDHLRRALAICESLSDANPTSAEARSDLSISHFKIGEALAGMGNLNGALQQFRQSLAIDKALSEKDPSNAIARGNMAEGHVYIGDLLLKSRDYAGAAENYRQALRLYQEIADADPTNAEGQTYLANTYFNLGQATSALAANENRERLQEARSLYQKSRDIWQELGNRGVLTGDLAKAPDEVARAIARCDAALSKLQAK